MAELFLMPQASPTMEVGRILAWRKQEGDKLNPQDVIAEVETDKASMEIEVFDPCFLLKILMPGGSEVPVDAPIAIIGATADEDFSDLLAAAQAQSASPKPAPPQEDATPAPTADVTPPTPPPATPARPGVSPFIWNGEAIHEAIMEMPLAYAPQAPRVRAAPAARHEANKRGIDLANVSGSGKSGRIMRADVIEASEGRTLTAAPAAKADASVPNSMMRKTIAKRLKASYLDAPVFYLTANLNCDQMVLFRSQLKTAGLKVSYNDILIKAVSMALVDVPNVNVTWGEDAITRHGGVHIGIAVAIEDGLITPVIRNANTRGLADLSVQTRDMVGRARDRKLSPEEYQGSTFTISNLGMMKIEQFTAIINPPNACILAAGALQQEAVVVDGALAVGWRMRVTLTCDHRAVDGALGAEFLVALRRYIENPVLLAS